MKPKTSPASSPAFPWRQTAILLVAWAVLYLWELGRADMDYSIEAFRAIMARNMLQSGDWLIPQFLGKPYLWKPPFMNWLIALFSLPVGDVTEWTARLPSALSALLISLLLWRWLGRLGRANAGFYGGVLFLVLPLVFEKGTRAEIDMNFTLWVALSLFFLFKSYLAIPTSPSPSLTKEWGARGGSAITHLLIAYFFLALAFLSKGPPCFLFFIGTWLAFQTFRSWKKTPWLGHLFGWCTFLIIVSLWIGPVIGKVGLDRLWATVQDQALERVGEASEINSAPFYFYPFSLLGGALPAFLFIPWLRLRNEEPPVKQAILFFLCWILSALFLFSLVAGKESRYLLPVYPAVAALGGLGMNRAFREYEQKQRGLRKLTAVLGTFLLIAAPALLLAHVRLQPNESPLGLLWALSWIAAGAVALWFLWKHKLQKSWLVILFALFIAKGFYVHAVVDDRNERKSPRQLTRRVHQIVPTEERIYYLGSARPQVFFYLKREVTFIPHLKSFLQTQNKPSPAALLLRENYWPEDGLSQLQAHYKIHSMKRLSVDDRRYVLLRVEENS